MDTNFWEEHKPKFLKQSPSKTTPIVEEAPPMKPYIEGDPYPAVPAELKSLRQWVLWKKELRDAKPTKVPLPSERTKSPIEQSHDMDRLPNRCCPPTSL